MKSIYDRASSTEYAAAPTNRRVAVHPTPGIMDELLSVVDVVALSKRDIVQGAGDSLRKIWPGFDVRFFDSGSSALVAGLRALNVRGRKVHISTNACPSIIEAILAANARPVIESTSSDGSLDPKSLQRSLSSNSAAVIQTHLYGRISSSRYAVEAIVANHGAALIDDAAQTWPIGGVRPIESSCLFGILSFGRTKPINCWGGGALVSRFPMFLEAVLPALGAPAPRIGTIVGRRLDSISRGRLSALGVALGFSDSSSIDVRIALLKQINAKSDIVAFDLGAWQLALLTRRLKNVVSRQRRAIENAKVIYGELSGNEELIFPFTAGQLEALAPFPVTLRRTNRRWLTERLAERGIETSWYHYPLHLLDPYREFAAADVRDFDEHWSRRLLLPCRDVSTENARLVANRLSQVLK